MEKTMYYSNNYGSSVYEEKKHGRLPKTMNFRWIMEIINVIYPKKWSLWSNLKLYNFDLLWKTMNKLWFYEIKLWYYSKQYFTIVIDILEKVYF